MGALKEFARSTSKFAQFDDDGVIEGIYEGHKIVVKDSFGEEKTVARYKINGKTFDSVSGSLANQMDEIKVGQHIKITRTGEKMETKYTVEVITAPAPTENKEKSWDTEEQK